MGRRLVSAHPFYNSHLSGLLVPGRVSLLCAWKTASVGRCMKHSASGRSVSQSVGDRGLGLWESNNSTFPQGQVPVRHSLPNRWASGTALWAEGPRWLPETHQGLLFPSLDQKWIRTWDHRACVGVGHLSERPHRSLSSLCRASTEEVTFDRVLLGKAESRGELAVLSPCSLASAEFSQHTGTEKSCQGGLRRWMIVCSAAVCSPE